MNDAGSRVIGEVGNPAWEVSNRRDVGQSLCTRMYHFIDLEYGCVRRKEEGMRGELYRWEKRVFE